MIFRGQAQHFTPGLTTFGDGLLNKINMNKMN